MSTRVGPEGATASAPYAPRPPPSPVRLPLRVRAAKATIPAQRGWTHRLHSKRSETQRCPSSLCGETRTREARTLRLGRSGKGRASSSKSVRTKEGGLLGGGFRRHRGPSRDWGRRWQEVSRCLLEGPPAPFLPFIGRYSLRIHYPRVGVGTSPEGVRSSTERKTKRIKEKRKEKRRGELKGGEGVKKRKIL